MNKRPSALYISYDGLLEPLGQGQVLNYLEKLADEFNILLITYEKRNDREDIARMRAMRDRVRAAGITWMPLAYHKSPSGPATAYDIAVGTLLALWLTLRHRVQLVHARSYVPALIGLLIKGLTGAHLLFDMRGFWADEKVDGGLWPERGLLYRVTKALERRFLLAADHVVTLTEASFQEISRFEYLKGRLPPISVIPTCVDLRRFQPKRRSASDRPFTFGYSGSVGTCYLFDEVLEFFKAIAARRPGARLLVVNRNDHALIRAAVARAGVPADRLELLAAEHLDMSDMVSRMHAASAFYRPSFSSIGRCPTKLAEYLACGVPCAGNRGVGDVTGILEGDRVGVAIADFSTAEIAAAAERLLALVDDAATAGRCVETAWRLFSLDNGVSAYRVIYRNRLNCSPEPLPSDLKPRSRGPA